MSSSSVNMICSKIHDVVQESGLHFTINQTPFSSYITIRRKFVNPEQAAFNQFNINHEPSCNFSEFKELKQKFENLKTKNVDLEEQLVNSDENLKALEKENLETIGNLHNFIGTLESKVKSMELEKLERGKEIESLENVIKTKDKIIQNMNDGFVTKIGELKLEISSLEGFKNMKMKEENDEIKKERKLQKKERQKTQRIERKAIEDHENEKVEDKTNNNATGKNSPTSPSYTPPGTPPPFCSEPSNLSSPAHLSSTNAEDIITSAERFNIKIRVAKTR